MTDLFSAIIRLRVSGLVRILSVSAYWNRDKERETEETREREKNRRATVVSCLGNNAKTFSWMKQQQQRGNTSHKLRKGLIWILHCCHMKDYFITYQDVIGPAFPGEVECCLLQLHHILVSAVRPMLRTQLSRVRAKTERNSRDIIVCCCMDLPFSHLQLIVLVWIASVAIYHSITIFLCRLSKPRTKYQNTTKIFEDGGESIWVDRPNTFYIWLILYMSRTA